MKDLYPNQKELASIEECEKAVKGAKSVRALNQLRASVVTFMNPGLLKLFQERYWAFKKCPDCAKAKYGG